MRKYLFVAYTPENDITKEPIHQSFEKIINVYGTKTVAYNIETKNTKGLGEVYSKKIHDEKILETYDIIVFVHADLYINDMFVLEKLEKEFDNGAHVVGIAGTKSLNLKEPTNPKAPIAWSNSPRNMWTGFVSHPVKDKEEGEFQMNNFGNCPAPAVAIDGLFIAIDIKNCKSTFDPNLKFHGYDLDFSVSCSKNRDKIIVSNILCTHMSKGAGVNSLEYNNAMEYIKTKWKGK